MIFPEILSVCLLNQIVNFDLAKFSVTLVLYKSVYELNSIMGIDEG